MNTYIHREFLLLHYLLVIKEVSPGDTVYSIITTVNNTALYIGKLLKESILKVLTIKKVVMVMDVLTTFVEVIML